MISRDVFFVSNRAKGYARAEDLHELQSCMITTSTSLNTVGLVVRNVNVRFFV